jgi:hypothetical protein
MLCAGHAHICWLECMPEHTRVHTPVLLQAFKNAVATFVDREGEWNGFCSK